VFRKDRSYWMFRVVSSRGTDISACVSLPLDATKADAREASDTWSSRVTAGTACHEYTVQYRRVPGPPSKRQWNAEWKRRCEKYEEAKLLRAEWLALSSVQDMD
jgi:hypothetical protein